MKPRLFRATNVVLALLCLMYFLTYIDRVNISTAAGAFRKEMHLNNTQIGFLFSAFAYPIWFSRLSVDGLPTALVRAAP